MWIDFELLSEQCAQDPPNLVAYSKPGGLPFTKGTALPIRRILAQLDVQGSAPAVVKYYIVTEEQIKELILYAQTFIEGLAALTEKSDYDQLSDS